jgi:hypothetical protein
MMKTKKIKVLRSQTRSIFYFFSLIYVSDIQYTYAVVYSRAFFEYLPVYLYSMHRCMYTITVIIIIIIIIIIIRVHLEYTFKQRGFLRFQ